MKRIGIDTIVSICFIGLGVFWLTLIAKLPSSQGIGTEFFPMTIVLCMIATAVVLLAQSLVKKQVINITADKRSLLRVAVLAGIALIYVLVLPIIGYRISTIIILASILWIFGLRKKIHLALIAFCAPLGLYYLFEMLLKVQLP